MEHTNLVRTTAKSVELRFPTTMYKNPTTLLPALRLAKSPTVGRLQKIRKPYTNVR
jgi:hypothetical protein